MKRILTVDDDPSILKALKLGLGSEHVEVDAVGKRRRRHRARVPETI